MGPRGVQGSRGLWNAFLSAPICSPHPDPHFFLPKPLANFHHICHFEKLTDGSLLRFVTCRVSFFRLTCLQETEQQEILVLTQQLNFLEKQRRC